MNSKRKIAFVSSYIPRKCGIATFTSDLIKNMHLAGDTEFEPFIVAMQSDNELTYNKQVKCRIRKNVRYDYISAADYLNFTDIDVVSVQHEFGLFGGQAGSFINLFLKRLNKPIITTLHTVLEKPKTEYFNSLKELCSESDRIVVMNRRGIKMLCKIYDVPSKKVELIPHGVPDLPFIDSNYYKNRLALSGRKTILTFGLLGRNKGIEVMLQAMPPIVKAEPSILYIILGSTHPEVLRCEGQSYKHKLEKIVNELGLHRNVVFYDRFVDKYELLEFLAAADIYVTPYLHKEQLTSGTLAFAVGAGKAIVSTPYWAAQELLAKGRGKLVPFGSYKDIARAVISILKDNRLSLSMRKKAYEYGRSMTWPKVGNAYCKLIETKIPSMSIPLPKIVKTQTRKTASYGQQKTCRPA